MTGLLYLLLNLSVPTAPIFHAPKVNISNPVGLETVYFVENDNQHFTPVTLTNISLRDLSVTAFDAKVSLNKQSKFQLTVTVCYLKVRTWQPFGSL